jgi:septum site-determining protein MinC
MSETVRLKGVRDGLLATLSGGEWESQRDDLLMVIAARPAFFAGVRLALDVGATVWRVRALSALRDALSERQIHLWAVLSESPVTEKTAQLLGLATRLSTPQPLQGRRAAARTTEPKPADRWVTRTVRSGVRLEAPGNVVIIGDVNPGGEVVAGGSILIWGRLRGVAHAGAEGDVSARIYALDMRPQQVRIADAAATGAEIGVPGQAWLEDGRVRIAPMNMKVF